MLTFREFYEICEAKKPDTPPHAVTGTYKKSDTGVQTYTLQRYEGPEGKPTKKEVNKLIVKRSGGKEVTKRLKKLAKSVNKIEEDLQQRRSQLAKRQRENVSDFKKRVSSKSSSFKERLAKRKEKEDLKREIKRELQTEQTPTMEPNFYSQQVARRQAAQKTAQIKHVHQELGAEARSQQAAKQSRLKSIMSR